MKTARALSGLLLVLWGAASCARRDSAAPVLLVGVDGVEWNVVLPLMAEGELPNLARLMERGSYGRLSTFRPTYSPVIWTSVATGKVPEDHGIVNFYYDDLSSGGIRLFHNGHRRTKAVWNIASDYDRRVAVVGWWMTYPVESVRGVMVAQTNTEAQLDTRGGRNIWKGTLLPGLPGQVFPPARQEEMLQTLRTTDQRLPELTGELFGVFPHPLSLLGRRLWANCRWAFRADATYLQIALDLLTRDGPYDLTMVYFGGPDVVGHRFWRYMRPKLYAHPPSEAEIENFGRVIADYYAYIDEAIGRLVDALPEEATVLVVSDHGMHAINREKRFDPDDPPEDVNSAEHQDASPGIFIAAGPAIRARPPATGMVKRRDLPGVGGVLDIAPTLLALLGIPIGSDMDGRVLDGILRAPYAGFRAAVPTHDTAAFLASRPTLRTPAAHEAERLEQLRALGYLRSE